MNLTKLERAALETILSGDHVVLSALRDQIRSCRVTSREFTGVGYFAELEVDVAAAPINSKRLVIDDVRGEIAGLEHGCGFVLFVIDGYLSLLEGYSYGVPWPTHAVRDFDLFYRGGARDVDALELDGPRL